MKYLVAAALLAQRVGARAGWCDGWGTLEWADEFDGDTLDASKWSVVCNDMGGEGCGALPFPTSTNGAECRSATCVPGGVSVGGGALTLTSQRSGGAGNSSAWTTGAVKTQGKAAWSTQDGAYRMCISAKLPGGGDADGAGQGIWPAHW
jgi:hypothetical protein